MTENNMEVVAWIWRGPHGGVIASEEKPSWHSTPLVTLTSAQSEIERLKRNTERFPELMARIVALKDQPLSERVDALRLALTGLTEHIHQYQWEADNKQHFGEKTVRSVSGNNGQGMGRQAIAHIPSHLRGVAGFIAAANPDTIAMLLGEFLSVTARAEAAEKERDALREALKPSGDTKAAYMGEFTIAIERHLNDDDLPEDEAESAVDPYEHVSVPWATIKEIMAAIRARALQPLEPKNE